MRKLLAFVIGVIGLGMMLSGCATNMFRDTKVKDAYIEKNYIDKVKVPKSKVVGDRNIKFYVGKVKDERKDKAVYVKRTAYLVRTGSTELANTELTIRNITEKALYNTGWGVVENRDNADFVVNTDLKDFGEHWGLVVPRNSVKSDIYVYKGDKVIIKKRISAEKGFFSSDLTARFKFVAGKIAALYYKALVNYFSSPVFKNAIEKAYKE